MSFAKVYDPLQAGTMDGNKTPDVAHDHAIIRAQKAKFRPPFKHTNPLKTLFVGRLNFDTTEASVKKLFEEYGKVNLVTLIYNQVTGLSEGYGFVTFERTYAAQDAYKGAHRRVLDDHRILVDYEHGRTMKGWIPRRLGGGFGGKKESGQLRFGGRDCPFRSSSNRSPSRQKESQHHRKHDILSSRSTRTSSSSRQLDPLDTHDNERHSHNQHHHYSKENRSRHQSLSRNLSSSHGSRHSSSSASRHHHSSSRHHA